jgi:hypothetical protein
MRIIHWSGLPAVVLVKGRGVCAVAVPKSLASREVLELASLVLSPSEYREFQDEVNPADGEDWRIAEHPEELRVTPGRRPVPGPGGDGLGKCQRPRPYVNRAE